jgi:putative membrane protein
MLKLERTRGTTPLLAALVFAVAACDRSESVATTDTTTAAAAGEAVPSADSVGGNLTTMSDANLVSVLETANAGEVEYSQVAVERATDSRVREYAQMMVREHGSMRDSVAGLAQRLGVTAVAPEKVNDLRENLRGDLEDLRAKNGADFDKEFMAEQVDMHQETLDLLEDLDDDTNTADLQRAIEAAKVKVRAHLERAKEIKDAID